MIPYKRCLAVLLITGLLTACTTITQLFGGKDNTEPPAPLQAFEPTLPVNMLWRHQAGEGSGGAYLRLLPAVSNGLVIIADLKGWIKALNRYNGKIVWQLKTGVAITAGPQVAEDLVVVGTRDAQVIALQQSNGQELWRAIASNEILAAPTIADGRVFINTVDDNLLVLAVHDGAKIWQYSHYSPDLVLYAGSAARVMDDLVVAGFADGKLLVFAAESGQVMWERNIAEGEGSTDVERMVDIAADPLLFEDTVYVVTYQGKLMALSLHTGEVFWEHELSSYTGLALSGDYLFATDVESTLWAFDRQTGQVMWRQEDLHARHITAPVVMGDAIVVGDVEGYLHWVAQADGHFLARINVDKRGALLAPPTVVGDQLYALSDKGFLVAYQVGD